MKKESDETITIGIGQQHDDELILDMSQYYIHNDEVNIKVNLDKQENENKIVSKLNDLFLEEEKYLTGNNVNKIEELIRVLPFEEKRTEMLYKKDELLASLKVKKLVNSMENLVDNNIGDNVLNLEDIIMLMDKYEKICVLNRNKYENNFDRIEKYLIKIHRDKFLKLLNEDKYDLESKGCNIKMYKKLKNYIMKLKKNEKFVLNIDVKNIIMEEIDTLNNKKSEVENKLIKLLNCDTSSLDQCIKLQELIDAVNGHDTIEKIDELLIENNFVDYINLGRNRRKETLKMFLKNNEKKFVTIHEIVKGLNFVIDELKIDSNLRDTINI